MRPAGQEDLEAVHQEHPQLPLRDDPVKLTHLLAVIVVAIGMWAAIIYTIKGAIP
jgi:hypothetical protein